ncbi:MAG TPA: DUF5818 domain-containing protein [Terracidiphilus sp.]|jgi:hypothetical protein
MRSSIGFYAICGLVLVFVLVAGRSSNQAGLALAQEQPQPPQQSQPPDQAQAPQPPDQNQNQAATFAGTVVKDGEQYDLRDSSGETFKLDATAQAKPYAGKTVKVTGQLDVKAKVIHIETIESVEG